MFLGRLEDAAGEAEREVHACRALDHGCSPALRPIWSLRWPIRESSWRVNGALVADRRPLVLADGDELAFLPPVSGG